MTGKKKTEQHPGRGSRRAEFPTDEKTNELLAHVAEHCPKLTRVSLVGCVSVNAVGLLALGRRCADLRVLDISDVRAFRLKVDCRSVVPPTADEFYPDVIECRSALQCFPRLQVALCNTSFVPLPAFLRLFSQSSPLLTRLEITNRVDDVDLVLAAPAWSRLRVLRLEHCHFADATVHAVAASCQQLRVLDITNADYLTDEGAAEFFALPNLTQLYLRCCRRLSSSVLVLLASRASKSLEYVSFRPSYLTVVTWDQPKSTPEVIAAFYNSFPSRSPPLVVDGVIER